MTLGSCVTHRKLASYIASITNTPVLVHNYPLAPEHPFPAALDFSEQVYQWLIERGYGADQIIFGGDSSGCALELSLMLKLKDNGCPLPKASFLFSPMLDFTLSGETIKTLAEIDPCLFEEDIRTSAKLYCNGAASGNPYITPLNASFVEFPPMLIQVGSSEILLDDALRLSKIASSVGVDVCLEIWDDMWHVFQGNIGELPEAEQALENVNTFLDNDKRQVLKIL